MGMFDDVECYGDQFRCSEGHDLQGVGYQTKDFECVLGWVHIADGRVSFAPGCMNVLPEKSPYTGTFSVYTSCDECPAFVQAKTLNLCDCWVEFEISAEADMVTSVKRVSPSTAEWLETEPKLPHMEGCKGPMPYREAMAMHIGREPNDPAIAGLITRRR